MELLSKLHHLRTFSDSICTLLLPAWIRSAAQGQVPMGTSQETRLSRIGLVQCWTGSGASWALYVVVL